MSEGRVYTCDVCGGPAAHRVMHQHVRSADISYVQDPIKAIIDLCKLCALRFSMDGRGEWVVRRYEPDE